MLMPKVGVICVPFGGKEYTGFVVELPESVVKEAIDKTFKRYGTSKDTPHHLMKRLVSTCRECLNVGPYKGNDWTCYYTVLDVGDGIKASEFRAFFTMGPIEPLLGFYPKYSDLK